jgi:nicotinamide-nucleotide amidase
VRLGEIIVSLEDVPMEQILYDWFTKSGTTLGLAESCTGGFLSHQLTQVPGSSGYFKGAIVCYNNQVKEDMLGVSPETIAMHGVVSEACAVEMAIGARKTLKSDYALSITGLLGPAASTDREVPGTIWMAIADKDRVHSKKFLVHYDRHRNKEVSISMAMLMIFKFIHSGN